VRSKYDPESVLGRPIGLYLYGTALPLMIERVLLDSTGDQTVSFRERAKCLYTGITLYVQPNATGRRGRQHNGLSKLHQVYSIVTSVANFATPPAAREERRFDRGASESRHLLVPTNKKEMNDDKKIKSYRMVLNAFMSFRDGIPYTNTHLFSDDDLLEITPEQLVKYFCFKVYGVAEPTPEMRPRQGQSNTIFFAKKAISYFMPSKLETWSIRSKSGNPTGSVLVNNLVKSIKKWKFGDKEHRRKPDVRSLPPNTSR
jgi:hypothetical protein